ncbi:TIGR03905 family TSCPD domain-containing protein [Fusobacterium sp. SB021]|uniref:TIGR03905 family TSCPD domain-containing protein n=1 Tax=Fusobacterium sp. SB021 TaxID=2744227 RepID=UPI003CF48064
MELFRTSGVCARGIELEVENGIVKDIKFVGGCSGNTQGIASLVKGMNVEEVKRRLRGIRCGAKSTSCPDQLAQILENNF